MKRIRPNIFCLLVLAAILAGCQAPPPPETASPSPEPAPVQAAPTPAAEYEFDTLPVTKEAIEVFYPQEGYTVKKITPWEGDFLVEYEGRRDETILEWVFGETGRRVKMNGHSDIAGYEIIQAGEVRYTTTGKNGRYHYIPETHRMIVLGDAHGYLERRYEWTPETYEGGGGPDVWWVDPSTPLAIGWWYGRGNVSGKYAQLYDARVDVDGLSFTFIPNGDNGDRYRTFFQGNTATPPYFETSFDEDSRCFTIRLYNTALESGDYVPEYTSPLLYSYPEGPHSFPAGSLGRDNHFLTDAQITQDGEDAVVTCTLTEKARRVTVECGDLANQDIPSLRIVFREYVWHMDEP